MVVVVVVVVVVVAFVKQGGGQKVRNWVPRFLTFCNSGYTLL